MAAAASDQRDIVNESPTNTGYGFRHGAFDITVLSDGYISIPTEILVTVGASEAVDLVISKPVTLDALRQTLSRFPRAA